MTEQEWHSGTELNPLLAFAVCRRAPPECVLPLPPLSDRKLRLFLVGCCRSRWELFTNPTWRRAVEVVEMFADGEVDDTLLEVYRHLSSDRFSAFPPEAPPHTPTCGSPVRRHSCVSRSRICSPSIGDLITQGRMRRGRRNSSAGWIRGSLRHAAWVHSNTSASSLSADAEELRSAEEV